MDAKELRPWFVRALSEHVHYCFDQGETVESALSGAIGMYLQITGRRSDVFLKEVAQNLIDDLAVISDREFLEAFVVFLNEANLEHASRAA